MNLTRSISKYAAITRINLQSNLAYVGEFAARSIFIVAILYVFIQLWRTTYSVTGTDQIAGLTLADTIWYLVLTETIMLSRMRVAGPTRLLSRAAAPCAAECPGLAHAELGVGRYRVWSDHVSVYRTIHAR